VRGRKHATEEERREAVRASQRRYAERNPEKVAQAKARYLQEHPERRAATVKRDWEKRRANPERYARFLGQCRESYRRHPLTAKEYTYKWRAANPDAWANIGRRRSEAGRSALVIDRGAADAYADIIRRDPCCYCGGKATAIDHIFPIAKGGEGDWLNLTPSCKPCNSRKKDKSLLAFLGTVASDGDRRAQEAARAAKAA